MTVAQAFGRYELLERVSAGGMAEVFRARDTSRGGAFVALKRILPNIAADEEFISMFEDEARIASQLEHPHIARTLDFGNVGGVYFISFEFVHGRDLKMVFDRCMKTGEQPGLPFLTYIFTRIGEGLSYAHSRKDAGGDPVSIVHRDVSPQNIVISYDGDVKLIDFGIAKAAGKLTRTQVGAIKGKFGYMSPEQIRGGEVDQRTDVFSLGICMWELLTMQRLFDAPNELKVLEKIRNTEIVPPSTINRRVPPGLDRIVCKALAKNVDERYRSAKELYRELNSLSKDTNTVATREQIAQYMRQTFPESGPARAGAAGDEPGSTAVTPQSSRVQEMGAMAADNKGSDLDVFEGLGKKSSGRSSAPPATLRGTPPPGNDFASKRPPLMGLTGNTPQVARTPPPPPGRGALPIVVPPPSKAPSVAPGAYTPPPPRATPSQSPVSQAAAAAPATQRTAGLDMDWDDDDEATHVFEKEEGSKSDQPPRPSGSVPASKLVAAGMPFAPAPTPMPPPANMKRTLMGLNNAAFQPPPPPPPGPQSQNFSRSNAPPPPPSSVGGAFARASSIPSAAPGPVAPPPPTIDPRPMARTSPALPPQPHTLPMPMPGPRPSAPSPYAQQHQQQQMGMMGELPRPMMPNRMEATALVRPPESSKTGLILGAIFAFVAVAAAVGYFMMTRTGKLIITAADAAGKDVPRVEVFVDGHKTACETTPCVLDESSGKHQVKIRAEGYEGPADQAVNVEARKETTVDFAFTGASAAEAGTGIKVAASPSQPGIKLTIDGKDVGTLPQEVKDLTPGDHKVRLSNGDRYAPLEKSVVVTKDEMIDLGVSTLKVLHGKATVTLGTPGAKVYIVSGTDRRELPTPPIQVDIDTSKQWALLATKTGFNDYNQPISFDDGVAEKAFLVTLDPKGTSQPYVANPPPPPQPVAQQPPRPPPPQPVSQPRPPPPPPPDPGGSEAATGEAFLNINSIPASSVVLDGKPIGNTPKAKFSVSPGTHTVLFVNAEQGLKKQISVTVGAGETKAAVGKLN